MEDGDVDHHKNISSHHSGLSTFLFPHSGLLCRQTEGEKFRITNLFLSQWGMKSPAIGGGGVKGEEATRLLDFTLSSTF